MSKMATMRESYECDSIWGKTRRIFSSCILPGDMLLVGCSGTPYLIKDCFGMSSYDAYRYMWE